MTARKANCLSNKEKKMRIRKMKNNIVKRMQLSTKTKKTANDIKSIQNTFALINLKNFNQGFMIDHIEKN